jgi:exosortase E/protease (VPEID-CTERM system)
MHMSSSADAIGSKTRQQLTGLRQFLVFAAVATIEIVVATFLYDTPRTNLVYWQDPIFYVSLLAKVAIVAFCLLVITAWPRREEIVALYRGGAAPGAAKYYLAANVVLFIALLAIRFLVSQMTELSVFLLAAYCVLLLATGASLAFMAAPPAFWWKLPRTAPVEIAIALAGGVLALWLGHLAQLGWTTLASATLSLSHWFLTLYEPSVHLDAEKLQLGVGDFSVWIYGPCSGYEGVALIFTFLSVYMWVFRHELRFPNVLLMLPLGMATIWILNAVRIAILVSIGAHYSPDVAIQGFHSQAGWISFLFVTLAAVALTRRVPFFAARQPHSRPSPSRPAAAAKPDLTIAYLAPFMAMVAANILASAFSPHDQWLYAIKVFAIGAALWWFRDIYIPLLRGISWNAVAVGLAVGVGWIATDPGRDQAAPLGDWIHGLPVWMAAAWLTLRAIGSVVLVPVAEELAFRGFLARWLISTRFEAVRFDQFGLLAFAGSSLAFGVLHERWLAASLAGAAYALLMYRTNRLSDPIAAHAVSNLAIMVWALAAQQWSLL